MQNVKTCADMMKAFQRMRFKIEKETSPEDENRQLERQAMKNFMSCGAGKKYLQEAGLEHFIQTNAKQRELYNLAMSFFQKIANDELSTLCLMGNAGTGKTFTALSILKSFCFIQKPPLMVTREYIGEDKKSHFEKIDAGIIDFHKGLYVSSDVLCDKYLSKDVSQKLPYLNTELLIVDEVGRVANWNIKSEPSVLFKILEYRLTNNLSTILCTNCNYDNLCNLLGQALISRLNQFGQFFNTDGISDMRQKENQDLIYTAEMHPF